MEQPSTANVKDTSTPAHDLVRVKTEPVNIETDPAFAEIKKLKTELMNCRNTILKSKLEAEQSRAKLSDNEMLIAEMHSAYELYRTEKETALAELKNSVGEKNKLIEELESNINYWKNQTSAIVAKHTDLQTEVAAATALLTERARELERILQDQAAEKQLWDQERKQFTLMVDLLEQIEQAHRQKKGISREPTTPSVSTEYTMHDREKANKNENERAFPPSPSTTPGEALSQRSNGSPAPFSAGIDRVEIATTEQPRSGSEGSFTKDKMVESNSIQSQRSPADQVFEGSGQIFVNDVYGMRRPIGTRLIKVYRSTQRTSGECVFIDNSPNEAQVPIVLPIGSALGVLFDGSELDIRGTENGTTVIYHLVLGSPQEAVELYTTIQNVGNEKALASPGNGASQQQVESRLQMAQVKPPSPTHPSRTSVSYIHLYNPQGTYTLQDQAPIMSGQPSQEQQYHMQRVPLQVLTQPTWHAYPPSSEGPSMGPVHSVPYHHPYNEYHPLLASGMTHGLHQQQLQTISRQHLVPMVHNPSHVNQPEQYQTASYTANSRR